MSLKLYSHTQKKLLIGFNEVTLVIMFYELSKQQSLKLSYLMKSKKRILIAILIMVIISRLNPVLH